MDPAYLALSRFRRRKFDSCIDLCTTLLDKNPRDLQMWCLKVKALTAKNWIDDTELEEEGIAEILLDEIAVNQMPRF